MYKDLFWNSIIAIANLKSNNNLALILIQNEAVNPNH